MASALDTRARLAARNFRSSSSFTLSMSSEMAPDGLATKSTAPNARASRVVSLPSRVRLLTMTTGRGFSRIKCSRKVSPSMRGMWTSRVMTSTGRVRTFSRASMPSRAVAITFRRGSDSIISLIIFRMKAESSTTRTWTGMLFQRPLEGLNDPGGLERLHEKIFRSGLQRLDHHGLLAHRGAHDDLRVGIDLHDLLDGVDAVHDRHRNVHGDDVGLQLLVELHGLLAVGRFARHHKAFLFQQVAQRRAHEGGIVGDQDPDRQGP